MQREVSGGGGVLRVVTAAGETTEYVIELEDVPPHGIAGIVPR